MSKYVSYSAEDLHSFDDVSRYACVNYANDIEFELNKLYIDEILAIRKIARDRKNWKLSDILRNYLDNELTFVFDTKDFQDVYYFTGKYFDNIEKIERLHNIKFDTLRKFVEWNIKNDINSEKYFEAWLYTEQQKIREAENRRNDAEIVKINNDELGYKNLRIYLLNWTEYDIN
jgi:hypothetical protein